MGVTTTSETIFRVFAVTPSFPGAPSLRLVIIRITSDSEAGVRNSEHDDDDDKAIAIRPMISTLISIT